MESNKKTASKFIWVFSAITAAFLGTAVFADEALPDILSEECKIEIAINGNNIELENKPFIANDTVYLPLREMLNFEGIDNEYITYNGGYAEFYVRSEKPIEYRNELYNFWINRVRIDSSYIYIGGFSEGSTENNWMMREAVLADGKTYVPYELFEKLSDSGQGVFDNLSVRVRDDANLIGKGYINENLNFTLELPFGWNKKYVITENENLINFYHKSTYDKYGSGEIFSIMKLDKIVSQKELDAENVTEPVKKRVIMQSEGSTYIMLIPGETQGQQWENYEEFEAMREDTDFIGKSILPIVLSDKGQPHDPTYTVTEFFSAFEQEKFFIMENLCTEQCVEKFFKSPDYVFGMKKASLENMEVDPLEYAKSSNDFNIFVTVNMVPYELSVFDQSQTSTSFYVMLQRQQDGRYLIDGFATGL